MPADPKDHRTADREKLIGLGKRSISKSYYPELRKRLDELENFRALLDRVSDAIFVVDADSGTILDVSGATPTMLGCDRSKLVGSLFKYLLPSHIQRFADNLFSSESERISIETEFFCPETGLEPVPVDMTMRIVVHQEKRRAIIVARDISERKRNEVALKKSHDLLEIRVKERTRELDRANRAKSEFLSVVSHELRTPLTSLLGFAKIIRKKLDATIFPVVDVTKGNEKVETTMDQIRMNLDIITSEGQRLTALINDVLDLAKLEANKVEFKMGPVEPEAFIQRGVQSLSAMIEKSKLVLLLDVESDLPKVNGDLDRLIQVMVNLLSNAVKFTGEGTITCGAHRVEDHVRISVADTGIGVPEEMQSIIFDDFAQAQASLSDRPRGTGLGLSICQKIVDGHGGHIWVESGKPKGSVFIFTLPVLEEPADQADASASPGQDE